MAPAARRVMAPAARRVMAPAARRVMAPATRRVVLNRGEKCAIIYNQIIVIDHGR